MKLIVNGKLYNYGEFTEGFASATQKKAVPTLMATPYTIHDKTRKIELKMIQENRKEVLNAWLDWLLELFSPIWLFFISLFKPIDRRSRNE